jgi:hypothetical protein
MTLTGQTAELYNFEMAFKLASVGVTVPTYLSAGSGARLDR